jgi:ubiquitin-protein ligase
MRFVTPILHANVNCYGRICHSVLGRQWTSDTKLSTVLGCVYGLLLNPDTSDPLDTDLVRRQAE